MRPRKPYYNKNFNTEGVQGGDANQQNANNSFPPRQYNRN